MYFHFYSTVYDQCCRKKSRALCIDLYRLLYIDLYRLLYRDLYRLLYIDLYVYRIVCEHLVKLGIT